jgi:hypothetical protein
MRPLMEVYLGGRSLKLEPLAGGIMTMMSIGNLNDDAIR